MNKKHKVWSMLLLLSIVSIMSIPRSVFAEDKRLEIGKKMYGQLCYKCHDYGQRGAPKLGYESDWISRLFRGRDALVNSALQGKGFMLPTGGGGLATRQQMEILVDYMLSTLKDNKHDYTPVRRIAEGLELYTATCFSCHNTGINNTPRLGDKTEWQVRAKKGMPSLIDNVIKGHGKVITGSSTVGTTIKPRSKQELESMIRYMLSTIEP